jgi:hypothetical protein
MKCVFAKPKEDSSNGAKKEIKDIEEVTAEVNSLLIEDSTTTTGVAAADGEEKKA